MDTRSAEIGMKPRLFIGSSVEGLDAAFAIQENLERFALVTVWSQGVFDVSHNILDSLVAALSRFDYGLFVFTPDDVRSMRDEVARVPRDNVIFELGLFCGRLGKHRSFIIAPRDAQLSFPTDLLGIKPATFDPKRPDDNLPAALAPACNVIKRQITNSAQYRELETLADTESIAKEWSEAFIDVGKPRRTALRGIWKGTASPRDRHKFKKRPQPVPETFPIEFEFQPGRKLVRATSVFEAMDPERGQVTAEYVGGFCDSTYIRMDYRIKEREILGSGSMVFELARDALQLTGHAVGYSCQFSTMYMGEIELQKLAGTTTSRAAPGTKPGRSTSRRKPQPESSTDGHGGPRNRRTRTPRG